MSPFALPQELPDRRIVSQARPAAFRRDDMAGAAGPRTGRAKDELAMRIVQRADRDGDQDAPMLGMTSETASVSMQDLDMGRGYIL
jgi:hypothetical protein